MKRSLLCSLLVCSITLSPLFSDAPASTPLPAQTENTDTFSQSSGSSLDNSEPLATDPLDEDSIEPQGTPVGPASQERQKAARKKQWQNIAIAVGAVVVAVVALIVVSSNDGHSK